MKSGKSQGDLPTETAQKRHQLRELICEWICDAISQYICGPICEYPKLMRKAAEIQKRAQIGDVWAEPFFEIKGINRGDDNAILADLIRDENT